MIILKSDYSPQAAAELQEEDNTTMLHAALYCADITCAGLNLYVNYYEKASFYYAKALGSPDENGQHTVDQWLAAINAAEPYQKKANQLLVDAGITIENKLIPHEDPENHFSHIETTIYNGGAEMEKVAQIERPIIDIEAETYEDNKSGWGEAFEPVAEVATKAGSIK